MVVLSASADGQDELERDALVELQVARGDDDAHAAHPEHPLDPVLAGKDVPLGDRSRARHASHCSERVEAGAISESHDTSTHNSRSGPWSGSLPEKRLRPAGLRRIGPRLRPGGRSRPAGACSPRRTRGARAVWV